MDAPLYTKCESWHVMEQFSKVQLLTSPLPALNAIAPPSSRDEELFAKMESWMECLYTSM